MAGAGHGGGGVYAMPAGTNCKTVIAAGSSIDHNSAQGFGGGVFFRGDADDTLDIVDSAIASNTSTSLGGGLYVQIGKTTISASTVNANSAPSYGGGIEVYGPLAVHSSTFDANVSPHGANIDNNGKTIVIDSSTIVAPASGSSTGSVYETNMGQPAFPTITNSILVGTCANDTPVASAHDIESPGSTCHLTGTSLANVTGTQLALGPFADNGGLTLTHKLLAGSVAIAKVPAATCVPIDQRNYVRSAPCDIGAVESDGLDDILFQDGFDLY